ncbi:hypothetical protein RJT34_26558 [Clitoria ternatea]|uniref:Uncharacterized protein n=1 Tax=Clitoria ternatea TaxID=43366 RepID=A0AAN9F700_CLITE
MPLPLVPKPSFPNSFEALSLPLPSVPKLGSQTSIPKSVRSSLHPSDSTSPTATPSLLQGVFWAWRLYVVKVYYIRTGKGNTEKVKGGTCCLPFSSNHFSSRANLCHIFVFQTYPLFRYHSPMARPLPMISTLPSTSHIGLAIMTLTMCAVALLMCASHSRKWRQWISCYAFEEEPVIELNNEAVMMSGNEQHGDGDSLWQKNILMGGKCQLPDFSGVIIYDSNGNIINPPKTSPPLLTWK